MLAIVSSQINLICRHAFLTHSRQSAGGANNLSDGSDPALIAVQQLILLVVTPVFPKPSLLYKR